MKELYNKIVKYLKSREEAYLSLFYDETCYSLIYIVQVADMRLNDVYKLVQSIDNIAKSYDKKYNCGLFMDTALTMRNLFIRIDA